MDIDFKKLMSEMSDAELEAYLQNIPRYTSDAVHAAIKELELRGRVFTDIESSAIEIELQKKVELKLDEELELRSDFNNDITDNIVIDESAPLLYTKAAIVSFAVFVNAAFAAILFAINLRNTDSKHRIPEVVGLGILITAIHLFLVYSVLQGFDPNRTFGVYGLSLEPMNFAAGCIFSALYWKKLIGPETSYRRRSIFVPFLLGAVVAIIQNVWRFSSLLWS